MLRFSNSNGASVQLYKHLECENYQEINRQILNFIQEKDLVGTSQHFWNPVPAVEFLRSVTLFHPWLAQHGLRLHSVAVTIGKNLGCCGIHIDTPPAVNKLSWPVLNTHGTFNRWFRPKVQDPQVQINELGGKSYIDITEMEEIGRMEVTRPCIINAGIPHDVWIQEPARFPRIGLQCMLFQEPVL